METYFENGENFKKLVASLKELTTSSIFKFEEDGMRFRSLDDSRVCVLDLFLSKESFDKYTCEETFMLGVRLEYLINLLKIGDKRDNVTLTYSKDKEDKLCVNLKNDKKNVDFDMNLIMIHDDEEIGIPDDIESSHKAVISSSEFQKMIKDVASIGDKCSIKLQENGISFEVTGESGSGNFFIETETEIEEDLGFRFNVSYLVKFAKSAGLSDNVTFFMDKNFPFCCYFDLKNGSFLKYWLAPLIDED